LTIFEICKKIASVEFPHARMQFLNWQLILGVVKIYASWVPTNTKQGFTRDKPCEMTIYIVVLFLA
jgi:hypothetical protein